MTKKYEVVITPPVGEPFTEMVQANHYQGCTSKIARKHGAVGIRVVEIWVGDKPERPNFQFGPHFDKEPKTHRQKKNSQDRANGIYVQGPRPKKARKKHDY